MLKDLIFATYVYQWMVCHTREGNGRKRNVLLYDITLNGLHLHNGLNL